MRDIAEDLHMKYRHQFEDPDLFLANLLPHTLQIVLDEQANFELLRRDHYLQVLQAGSGKLAICDRPGLALGDEEDDEFASLSDYEEG